MGEEVLSKLVEFIGSASPVIWETARRQVVVDLVQCIVWMVLFAAVAYACVKWSKYFWRKHQEDKYGCHEVSVGFLIGGAVFAVIIVAVLLTHIIGVAINPNYYAIRLLLGYVQ